MALMVTGVGSVIHVYSIGYMKDDEGYGRFFAYLNLFLFFMLLLVLGRSLLVLFVGWEGVGLASYLLIGFWFHDLANARAGKKAFVTNRIGDAGFLLGMFVLFQAFGTLDMDRIGTTFAGPTLPAVSASLVGVLLFIGATGKSAQIPLHVWLPDAMAGPSPASPQPSSPPRSPSSRPTSRRCSPIRPSRSSASCSSRSTSAPTTWRSFTSSPTPSSRPSFSSAP